jgi:hypothetical protein
METNNREAGAAVSLYNKNRHGVGILGMDLDFEIHDVRTTLVAF